MKVTEILSIYAACLSTIVFVWNISRAIPRYKVDLIFGSSDEEEPRFGVYIFVRNPSPHTVHLAGIDILYPYKPRKPFDLITHIFKYRRMSRTLGWVHSSLSNYKLDDKCPAALESGKSHSVFIPDEILEKILVDSDQRKLMACVQDQLWRNKYSKEFLLPKLKKTQDGKHT